MIGWSAHILQLHRSPNFNIKAPQQQFNSILSSRPSQAQSLISSTLQERERIFDVCSKRNCLNCHHTFQRGTLPSDPNPTAPPLFHAAAMSASDIFAVNPYEGHPSLTQLEASVLWEYAKLAQHLKLVTQKTRSLAEEPDKEMLFKLRVLEKKMGLVLTLFKASVWGVINEQPEPAMNSGSYSDPNDTTIMR